MKYQRPFAAYENHGNSRNSRNNRNRSSKSSVGVDFHRQVVHSVPQTPHRLPTHSTSTASTAISQRRWPTDFDERLLLQLTSTPPTLPPTSSPAFVPTGAIQPTKASATKNFMRRSTANDSSQISRHKTQQQRLQELQMQNERSVPKKIGPSRDSSKTSRRRNANKPRKRISSELRVDFEFEKQKRTQRIGKSTGVSESATDNNKPRASCR